MEDLALLEAALDNKLQGEWQNIALMQFGKASSTRDALEHFDKYFVRGKIGQHVLTEMKWPGYSVMLGNTEKSAVVRVAPAVNLASSKFLGNFIWGITALDTENFWDTMKLFRTTLFYSRTPHLGTHSHRYWSYIWPL